MAAFGIFATVIGFKTMADKTLTAAAAANTAARNQAYNMPGYNNCNTSFQNGYYNYGTNTTVYTLNEDGKTLTRKLKYEYKHDENGQVIEKKAYRWDAYRELWKPAYLLTVTPGAYETKLNYAEWNVKESAFNNNKQQSIYREDSNINLLADTQDKK